MTTGAPSNMSTLADAYATRHFEARRCMLAARDQVSFLCAVRAAEDSLHLVACAVFVPIVRDFGTASLVEGVLAVMRFLHISIDRYMVLRTMLVVLAVRDAIERGAAAAVTTSCECNIECTVKCASARAASQIVRDALALGARATARPVSQTTAMPRAA